MKKNRLLIISVLIAIVLLGGFLWWRRRAQPVGPTPEPEGRLIETPFEERPYITLIPSQDGHWLTLNIERIRHGKTLEYELIYNTASGVTQAQGTLTLRLRSDEGVRKFVSEFHLQQGEDKLTSIDNNFSFTGNFSPTTFYLTMLTVGLPGEVKGEVVGGPYG